MSLFTNIHNPILALYKYIFICKHIILYILKSSLTLTSLFMRTLVCSSSICLIVEFKLGLSLAHLLNNKINVRKIFFLAQATHNQLGSFKARVRYSRMEKKDTCADLVQWRIDGVGPAQLGPMFGLVMLSWVLIGWF